MSIVLNDFKRLTELMKKDRSRDTLTSGKSKESG